jgi:mycofactocin precursor
MGDTIRISGEKGVIGDQRADRFLIQNVYQLLQTMKGDQMEAERKEKEIVVEDCGEIQEPAILEEVNIEELAVDGICGIY